MDIITFIERPRYDIETAECIGIGGTGRLVFEVKYFITNTAVERGLEDKQREIARQHCKKEMLRMLHDAIAKLEAEEGA